MQKMNSKEKKEDRNSERGKPQLIDDKTKRRCFRLYQHNLYNIFREQLFTRQDRRRDRGVGKWLCRTSLRSILNTAACDRWRMEKRETKGNPKQSSSPNQMEPFVDVIHVQNWARCSAADSFEMAFKWRVPKIKYKKEKKKKKHIIKGKTVSHHDYQRLHLPTSGWLSKQIKTRCHDAPIYHHLSAKSLQLLLV